ncbi:MAG: ferrochelatase [Pirellulaceae bacterium]
MSDSYDAILLLSFGGPECRDDVIPFLENVLRGKQVPRERMLEVAEHYYHFDRISPINQQNRDLLVALSAELAEHGPRLPLYWGNRNWTPYLADTLRKMADDGVRRALALVTSAYSSYSGCRQYREDIARARGEVGERAPVVDKIRPFFNHPRLIETLVDRVRESLGQVPSERHATTHLIYTAHSVPMAMANGCDYVRQLRETCRLVTQQVGNYSSELVYQSRSGPPSQPWLEPDIRDYLGELTAGRNYSDVVVVPVGFMSDHMEVLYDLDYEARQLCETQGLNMVRAKTPGTHPQFLAMIRELICERTGEGEKRWMGTLPPCPDFCPAECCPSGRPIPATDKIRQLSARDEIGPKA